MEHRSGLLIVVADDDEVQAQELSAFLRIRGHRVLTATDGEMAVELIDRHRPRVAFIDVNMPGANGIRVAEIAAGLGHEFALILISGHPESIVRANRSCVSPFAVVEKPLPLRHIERFVDAVRGEVPRDPG